jgi:hypothetical protein
VIIRHVPHLWIPRDGEVLRGYPCDPRPDCLGILVSAHEPGAKTDHGLIEIGQVVHVRHDERIERLALVVVEPEGGSTDDDTLTAEAAIQWQVTHGPSPLNPVEVCGFAIALRLPGKDEKQISVKGALLAVLDLRQKAGLPPLGAAPAPAAPSATPEKPAETAPAASAGAPPAP